MVEPRKQASIPIINTINLNFILNKLEKIVAYPSSKDYKCINTSDDEFKDKF
jgi:hypothetical protein